MDRFQEMQVFLAVAEHRGFAAAARRLNLSPASVTRAVAALEERIGTQLLSRTTRSVRLPEAGQRYAEDCRRILADLLEAEESAAGSHARPRGQLTVSAPVLFGELFVTPLLVDFLDAYPELRVRALLLDRLVNLVDEGVDAAIRIGHLPDSSLHAVRVGAVRQVVCAAPAYLAAHGRPEHPRQLEQARIIAAASSQLLSEWQFVEGTAAFTVRLQPRLEVNANGAAIRAACLGWGLTRVLSYQVADRVARGELEIVLQAFEPPPLPIHVVYPDGRRVAGKVRAFIDFCARRLRQHPALR